MNKNIKGILFLIGALLVGSMQGVAVKWIGGNYSALQIVTFRSLVALPATLIFFRREGGLGLPKTKNYKLQYLRGLFLFLSYTTYMMGLASMPLADIEAIRFSGPLMITLLSVFVLGEKVGPRRWVALGVGFLGVLLIVKPGSANFNLGSVFVLISVLFYALTMIVTRKLQSNDSSATQAFYSSQVYLILAILLIPLPFVVGEPVNPHPSIAFLLRPWGMPTLVDLLIMLGLGFVWATWMYLVTRAYSLADASVAAPFEYVSLPINIMWGLLIWGDLPTWSMLGGAALTLGSGMYVLYRERQEQKTR
jgi:drug/metabolite transporter (DMT)-like permease